MSSSIYALLNFPADPILQAAVTPLSANVMIQMNAMPSLVNAWQQEDIANQDTTGYYQNPALTGILNANTAANVVVSSGNSVTGSTSTITNLLVSIYQKSNAIFTSTASSFLYHTNRMSNVVEMGFDVDNPHFLTSIGYGKVMIYLTNKSDNVQNNAPMIGSFGSIFASNVITANANTYLSYAQLYAATVSSNTSNISLSNAQALSLYANNVYNMMTNYMNQDIAFFQDTKSVMDSYNAVSQFKQLGQTETDLIMNHIGTEKIKTRLASE